MSVPEPQRVSNALVLFKKINKEYVKHFNVSQHKSEVIDAQIQMLCDGVFRAYALLMHVEGRLLVTRRLLDCSADDEVREAIRDEIAFLGPRVMPIYDMSSFDLDPIAKGQKYDAYYSYERLKSDMETFVSFMEEPNVPATERHARAISPVVRMYRGTANSAGKNPHINVAERSGYKANIEDHIPKEENESWLPNTPQDEPKTTSKKKRATQSARRNKHSFVSPRTKTQPQEKPTDAQSS